MRLVYVDDSGDERLTLYCFVEVDAAMWVQALEQWLSVRRALRDQFGVPVRRELHAVDFLSGRGNPSQDSIWNRNKGERVRAGRLLAESISELPIRWAVSYGSGNSRGSVYRLALADLNRRIERRNDHALVMIDGDGTDPAYSDSHRDLSPAIRRVIEDPWHQGSHSSQWIMIADFIAYVAFQGLVRRRPVVEDWYNTYFAAGDIHGGPIRLT